MLSRLRIKKLRRQNPQEIGISRDSIRDTRTLRRIMLPQGIITIVRSRSTQSDAAQSIIISGPCRL